MAGAHSRLGCGTGGVVRAGLKSDLGVRMLPLAEGSWAGLVLSTALAMGGTEFHYTIPNSLASIYPCMYLPPPGPAGSSMLHWTLLLIVTRRSGVE